MGSCCNNKKQDTCGTRLPCRKGDTTSGKWFQAYPSSGSLARNINMPLPDLRRILSGVNGEVYCYVVDTVEYDGEWFQQTGSGPNFEGGIITLCTCKHWMRSYRPPEAWKDIWIAGITGKKTSAGYRNFLFYLMQVEGAFASQRDLFHYLPVLARNAKLATRNRLGDVFQPSVRITEGTAHDAGCYLNPIAGHSHEEGDAWKDDIGYEECGGRFPALLVGKPERSFLWNKPQYMVEGNFRQKHFILNDFLSCVWPTTAKQL